MDLGKTSVQPVLSLPIDPAPASMLWGNVTCPLITPIFFAICTLGFPCGASGKESACNAGDAGESGAFCMWPHPRGSSRISS